MDPINNPIVSELFSRIANLENAIKDLRDPEVSESQWFSDDGTDDDRSAYRVTGLGSGTVNIAAGSRIVIHISEDVDLATTVAASSGTLYREYTYASGVWGEWTIGTPTESTAKRTFRRAEITVSSGKITHIVHLAYGNLEAYRFKADCEDE